MNDNKPVGEHSACLRRPLVGQAIWVMVIGLCLTPVAAHADLVRYSFDPGTTATFDVFGPTTVVQLGNGLEQIVHDKLGTQTDTFSGSFFLDTTANMIEPETAAITITGNGSDATGGPYNLLPSQNSDLQITLANITDQSAEVAGDVGIDIELQSNVTGANSSALRLAVQFIDGAPYFNDTFLVTGGVSPAPAEVSPVPEPSTLLSLAAAIAMLVAMAGCADTSRR